MFRLNSEEETTPDIGAAGQLSRQAAERFKLRQDAFVAEMVLDSFYEGYRRKRSGLRYQPISRFPAVERDFSLVLPDGRRFSEILNVISAIRREVPEVVKVDALDRFMGKNIPSGKFSLMVRVTFQSDKATLTEAQLTDFSSRILTALEQKLGVSLRA